MIIAPEWPRPTNTSPSQTAMSTAVQRTTCRVIRGAVWHKRGEDQRHDEHRWHEDQHENATEDEKGITHGWLPWWVGRLMRALAIGTAERRLETGTGAVTPCSRGG
jgi:hypothetical protein